MSTSRLFRVVLFGSLIVTGRPAHAEDSPPIRFGMIDSLFEGKDEKAVIRQMEPFADYIKKQSGLKGEFSVVKGTGNMAKELAEGKIGLGVVHGVEYGWLKQHCAECKPLLVAVNYKPVLKVYVLVNQNSTAKSVEDLKGKNLIWAEPMAMHMRLFRDRLVKESVEEYFKVKKVYTADEAIDAVIDGEADATIVGNLTLDSYRKDRPGRAKRLKTLVESADFPPAAVVYHPGKVAKAEDLEKFKANLLKANQTRQGRDTLTLWRLTEFRAAPAEYEKMVEEIVKVYAPGK